MKRTSFLRKPIAHTFKRPRSKAEEPDCLFHRNPSSIMIATQPLLGEEQGVIKIDGILTKKSLGGQKRNRQEKAVMIDNGNYYPIY
jgi:hypothetical protein